MRAIPPPNAAGEADALRTSPPVVDRSFVRFLLAQPAAAIPTEISGRVELLLAEQPLDGPSARPFITCIARDGESRPVAILRTLFGLAHADWPSRLVSIWALAQFPLQGFHRSACATLTRTATVEAVAPAWVPPDRLERALARTAGRRTAEETHHREAMLHYARRPEETLAAAAIETLGLIGASAGISVLLDRAHHRSSGIRRAARVALIRVLPSLPQSIDAHLSRALLRQIDALLTDASPALAGRLLQAAGRIGGAGGLAVLRTAEAREDSEVGAYAAHVAAIVEERIAHAAMYGALLRPDTGAGAAHEHVRAAAGGPASADNLLRAEPAIPPGRPRERPK